MSECARFRSFLAPYCVGTVLELGAGGDATVPHAITFDLPKPYAKFGNVPQMLRGDCRNLSFICDEAFDVCISHHLLEDFTYKELVPIVTEWRRVLKPGGLLITNCPDQQRFLAHCARTGQGNNLAHKEADFSLQTFIDKVLNKTGPWETIRAKDVIDTYSFISIVKKLVD